jgi:hypothetical protein
MQEVAPIITGAPGIDRLAVTDVAFAFAACTAH